MDLAGRLGIPQERLAAFCTKHGICKLSLFGSILREDFGPDSDIDVLVEFQTGRTPGLAFFSMQDELSDLCGRPVDLNTKGFLSGYFQKAVLASAEVQYVAS